MARQKLTDGSGAWFDIDAAEKFSEYTYWNGNNHISKATGSQWYHENLYRTKSGKWVLGSWSNYQGTTDEFREIDNEEAAQWFIRNEYEDDDIPESVFPLVEAHINSMEI